MGLASIQPNFLQLLERPADSSVTADRKAMSRGIPVSFFERPAVEVLANVSSETNLTTTPVGFSSYFVGRTPSGEGRAPLSQKEPFRTKPVSVR